MLNLINWLKLTRLNWLTAHDPRCHLLFKDLGSTLFVISAAACIYFSFLIKKEKAKRRYTHIQSSGRKLEEYFYSHCSLFLEHDMFKEGSALYSFCMYVIMSRTERDFEFYMSQLTFCSSKEMWKNYNHCSWISSLPLDFVVWENRRHICEWKWSNWLRKIISYRT